MGYNTFGKNIDQHKLLGASLTVKGAHMRKGSLVRYRPAESTALENNLSVEYSFGIVLESYILFHTTMGHEVQVKEYLIYDMRYGMKFNLSDDLFEVERVGGKEYRE